MANAARQLNLIATQLTLNFYLAIVFACVLCMPVEKTEREGEWEWEVGEAQPTWVHCLRAKSARCGGCSKKATLKKCKTATEVILLINQQAKVVSV